MMPIFCKECGREMDWSTAHTTRQHKGSTNANQLIDGYYDLRFCKACAKKHRKKNNGDA